jgi:hypothetical protein
MKLLIFLAAVLSMSAYSATYMDYSCDSNYRFMNKIGGSAMLNIYNSSTFKFDESSGVIGTLSEIESDGHSKIVLSFYRRGIKLAEKTAELGEELNLSSPVDVGGLILGSVSAKCTPTASAPLQDNVAVDVSGRETQNKDPGTQSIINVTPGPTVSAQ